MAKNKEQHYVPQFYLRNFSIDEERKNVSLFNKKSEKLVLKALIRYQARKPYFYGKDLEIEKIFQKLEGEASILFDKIIANLSLPSNNTIERFVLLRFILITKNRTLLSADQINEMIDRTIKQIWSKDKSKEDFFEKHSFAHANAIGFVLEQIFGMVDRFSTLNIKILENLTNLDFVTSDNPVCPYNIFLEQRNHPGGHYGIESKGIMYYFSLSPKILLIVYDDKTYKVGNVKDQVIRIHQPDEILEINTIIYMNSYENIFFNGNNYRDEDFEFLKSKSKTLEEPNQFVINEYEQHHNYPEETRVLMHQYRTNLKLKHKPSYIRITKNAKKFKIGNLAAVPR